MAKNYLRITFTTLIVSGLLLSLSPAAGRVQAYAPEAHALETGGILQAQDDGGTAEVGVEWITDWPGTADDRANWYYSCNDLYNELGSAGWNKRFNWGNTNAWEKDFKRTDLGGLNNSVIDSVDLAMMCTHGSSAWDSYYGKTLSSVYFSSNNHDWHLSPGEARAALGDADLEWLAFDSCSVLRDDSMGYWHEAFNGLHLMLGFANTMYVVYRGDGGVWGDQMRQKGWWIFGHGAKTVTQAWFSAVEDQQPSGVRARVLAEVLDNYNDYMWGQGYVSADYPNNGAYWYWDHVAGTPEPLQLAAVPTSLPIYRVVPRTVDEDYVRQIGMAFGMTGTVLAAPDGSAFYMASGFSDTQQLRVDALSGGYFFQDLNELWTKPEMPRVLPPSGERAATLAGAFLYKNGEGLPGYYGWHTIVTPTAELEGPTTGQGLQVLAASAPTSPTNYAISYARTLDIGGGQRISVVGPGARLNVYVGDNSQIIGLKGGWRDVEPVQPTAGLLSTTAISVPIKSAEEAWQSFLITPSQALAQAPLALQYDRAGKPEPTLAYYEQTLSAGQVELIPTWIFVADLYTQTNTGGVQAAAVISALVASDVKLYVPAAADPMAQPQASITAPAPGTRIKPGQGLTLDGTASGGTPPYTYQWSSSVDGPLGTGASLPIAGLSPDLRGGSLQPNVITLLVTDANGQSATDSVAVTVIPPLYLPLVIRS